MSRQGSADAGHDDRDRILAELAAAGPLTAADLAARLELHRTTIYHQLGALVTTGHAAVDDSTYPRTYAATGLAEPHRAMRGMGALQDAREMRAARLRDEPIVAEVAAGQMRVRVVIEGVAPGVDMAGLPSAVERAALYAVRWAAERERGPMTKRRREGDG